MTDSNRPQSDGSSSPYASYDSPAALLADTSLAQGRKIDILRAWERDLRQLMVAEGEGLSDKGEQSAGTPERLKQVSDALKQIGAADQPDHAQSDVSGSSTT